MSPYEMAARMAQQGYSAEDIRKALIREAEEAAKRISDWIERHDRTQQQEDGR